MTERTQSPEDRSSALRCPDCSGRMTPRTSAHGVFWGCVQYPACRGTRDSEGRSRAERHVPERTYQRRWERG